MDVKKVKANGEEEVKQPYEELHMRIEDGDINAVKLLLQQEKPGHSFCFEGTSALKKSHDCKQVEICSFLINYGVTFKDDAEAEDIDISEEDVKLLNYRLWYFNQNMEESCIYKLMYLSTLSSAADRNINDVLLSMYKDLFESECIKFLMKVLERESPHIVYDFGSENTDRIYIGEIGGLSGITVTEPNSAVPERIYIGAKKLTSTDSMENAEVKGVLAEEFCHSALKYVFANGSKPFREDEETSVNVKQFRDLVNSIKTYAEESQSLTPIIKDVFNEEVYERAEWESELIARVPHLMGILGEEDGRRMLNESPPLSDLLRFYDDHVVPACKSYIVPLYYTIPMMDLESMHKNNGYLTVKEKKTIPLKDVSHSFKKSLIPYEGMQLLYTNCTKLAAMHVYQELKREILYHIDKVCLFFTLETFEKIKGELQNAFTSKLCQYLIIVAEKNLPNSYKDVLGSGEDKFGKLKVILISHTNSQISKYINYEWSGLTHDLKQFCLEKTFIFNEKQRCLKDQVNEDDLSKLFTEKELMNMINGHVIKIGDSLELLSQGYSPETYIERKFQVMTMDSTVFQNLTDDTAIFLSGYIESEFEGLFINKKQVQRIEGPDEEIQCNKSVFINNNEKPMSFKKFQEKIPGKRSTWLHHVEKLYYVSSSTESDDTFSQYLMLVFLSENEVLDFLKRNKILIISDNAGYGKSTVISSIISCVKRNIYDALVFRIYLWNFSLYHTDSHSECSDHEDIFDEIFQTIGLRNRFERWHFQQSQNQANYFIFFDGYDEIPKKYKSKVLELLSFLRRSTNVKIIITTRKHEQQELEDELNAFSHQLVPFNDEEQVNCLEKFLKWKLNYPYGEGDESSQREKKSISRKIEKIILELENKETKMEYKELILAMKNIELRGSLDSIRLEIDKLDLTRLAVNILEKTQLEKLELEFMGIPLHLYMVGCILYDDNFNLQIGSDIYSLYNKFIDQKILIYVEEKEKYLKEGNEKDMMVARVREYTFKIHTQLADLLFYVGKVTGMDEKDRELCSSLGIVSIRGGEILFLHQTFAEFFRAESIRKNIDKGVIIEILFEKKHEIVTRFLSCALERINFENITKEFFKDFDFLLKIMIKIVNLNVSCEPHEIKFYIISSFKILKKLLKEFELTDKPNFFNEFIQKLKKLQKGGRRYSTIYDRAYTSAMIGGCVNVEMMKHLMSGNLRYNSIFILYFVRFAECIEEVIDVMNECISKNIESGKTENKGNEESVLKYILQLLRIYDLDEFGIFSYAACNERGEIFPQLLGYFRKALGKEKFMREVIKGIEYKNQMRKYVLNVHTNKNCRLLKEMYSVFENEMKNLFDSDFKFSVIVRAFRDDRFNEKCNLFKSVTNLFIDCFGIENLKEVLLNKDSFGDYLIHLLIEECQNANLMNCFHCISNILGDDMKKILKSKGKHLRNIFHFAAHNKNDWILDVLNLYLYEREIKELLIGKDKIGRTCLHYAATWNLRKLSVFLKYAYNILENDKNYLEELILAKDKDGDTFLHSLDRFRSVFGIEEILYNPKKEINEIFNHLRINLSDKVFKKLLRIRNKYAETFQISNRRYKKEITEYCTENLQTDLF